MTSVLAIVAGLSFGTQIVVVRMAMMRATVEPDAGAVVANFTAAIVALVSALVVGVGHDGLPFGHVWPYLVIGLIAPGSSYIAFFHAIRLIGPSRTGVFVGTSPILGVLLAIVFIDEHLTWIVAIGTALTVSGALLLTWDRRGGTRLIPLGVALALFTALSFAVRDVVARHITDDADLPPAWRATFILSAAVVVISIATALRLRSRQRMRVELQRALPLFAYAGAAAGCGLISLLAAFEQGRVQHVSPLANASQALATISLSSALIARTEASRRVIAAMVLVLVGGTLIIVA